MALDGQVLGERYASAHVHRRVRDFDRHLSGRRLHRQHPELRRGVTLGHLARDLEQVSPRLHMAHLGGCELRPHRRQLGQRGPAEMSEACAAGVNRSCVERS